jgi:hypothetical protein
MAIRRVLWLSVVLAMVACGCKTGIASNNNDPVSSREELRQGLEVFRDPQHLYWMGPTASGYVLRFSNGPFGPEHGGITLAYVRDEKEWIYVTTMRDRHLPAPDAVYPGGGHLVATALTDSGQLVAFKTSARGTRPSDRTISALKRALRAMTTADLNRLPEDF